MDLVSARHFLQLVIVRVLIVIPSAKVAPRFRQALVFRVKLRKYLTVPCLVVVDENLVLE